MCSSAAICPIKKIINFKKCSPTFLAHKMALTKEIKVEGTRQDF